MKPKNIVGISLIFIGIVSSIILALTAKGISGESAIYVILFTTIPITIAGLLILFSLIGAGLVCLGVVIFWLMIATKFYSLNLVFGSIMIIGIIYGLVEGIIKLIKFIGQKNKK